MDNIIENPRHPAHRIAAAVAALAAMRIVREAPGIKAHPVTAEFVLTEAQEVQPLAWLMLVEAMVEELPKGHAFQFPGFIIRLAQ